MEKEDGCRQPRRGKAEIYTEKGRRTTFLGRGLSILKYAKGCDIGRLPTFSQQVPRLNHGFNTTPELNLIRQPRESTEKLTPFESYIFDLEAEGYSQRI